jgi:helicase
MKTLETRKGAISFPAFVPVSRLGTRGGLDARLRSAIDSIAHAVVVSHATCGHPKATMPAVPVMVTSGSSALLSYGAMASRRGDIGEIHFPSTKKSLTPEAVLAVQEEYAEVAFTFDFPIPYGLDPIEGFRRQDLTISCALWAAKARKRKDLPLFACVQGWDRQSYRQCANAYRGREFDGLAIGGLSTRADSLSNVLSIVGAVLEEADGKPVHVFNLGDPGIVAALFGEGVDSISSNAWMSLANEGRFWNNAMSRLEKPSAKDKELLALWNLSCATGEKPGRLVDRIVRLGKAIEASGGNIG